jgi:hypothetical protein
LDFRRFDPVVPEEEFNLQLAKFQLPTLTDPRD